ncbi:MAG: hypothetical protein KC550_03605 [Nanoarchaeota archaeon]|nr:hypothetical protein [Nanoarchaeota archaeon]
MEFLLVCKTFEKLEKTSKRLEKVLILRDFINNNKNEFKITYNTLDIIAGNFQREINKRSIGISLKSIISVLSFIGKKNEKEIEKKFNKIGDLGILSEEIFLDKKQSTLLSSKKLEVEDIIFSLKQISKLSGKDSNKKKLEILSKLFLNANEKLEFRFLSRLLIDDLRIGASEGVLKEACVNTFFPQILNIHQICYKCGFINLNMKNCFNCNEKINLNEQESIVEKKFKFIELGTPENEIGLKDYFKTKNKKELINFSLRIDKNKYFLKTKEPREIYNSFLSIFEKKYNLLNSFSKVLNEMKKNPQSILESEIIIGNPIKSMLGTREKNIEDSYKTSLKPALIDFKYDGLRVQIHNNKGNISLFSRNLDNISKQFPEIIEYIQTNFPNETFVLDSECVGYDFDKQKFLPFQMLSKRILTKNINDVSHIKVIVKIFDILYFNEKTLIDEPYKKRREIINKLMLNRKLKQNINMNINFNKLIEN